MQTHRIQADWAATMQDVLWRLEREWEAGTMPDLTAQACVWMERLGICAGGADGRMVLAAAQACDAAAAGADEPAYHNRGHTAQVLAAACVMLLAVRAGRDAVANHDAAVLMTAALGHDLGHPGLPNPANDVGRNERVSVARLLQALNGLARTDTRGRLAQMIAATDPVCGRQGEVDELTAMLLDADLAFSAGTGMAGLQRACVRLTQEYARAGLADDFTTRESQRFFMRHILGERFSSRAGRACLQAQADRLIAQLG